MELFLTRYDLTPARTLGMLAIGGVFQCYTLEDAVREGPKVPGQTAIPYGRYQVVLTMSQRFGHVLPLLLDVPNFTGIRIHAGNTAADTEGCILVGTEREGDAILHSRVALDALMERIQSAHEGLWIAVEDFLPRLAAPRLA